MLAQHSITTDLVCQVPRVDFVVVLDIMALLPALLSNPYSALYAASEVLPVYDVLTASALYKGSDVVMFNPERNKRKRFDPQRDPNYDKPYHRVRKVKLDDGSYKYRGREPRWAHNAHKREEEGLRVSNEQAYNHRNDFSLMKNVNIVTPDLVKSGVEFDTQVHQPEFGDMDVDQVSIYNTSADVVSLLDVPVPDENPTSGNAQNNTMQTQTLLVRPIRIQHSRVSNKKLGNGQYKNVIFTGVRQFEKGHSAGNKAYLSFDWNTVSMLDAYHRLATDNLISQTGMGAKSTLAEGVSGSTSANGRDFSLYTYIMNDYRQYRIANINNCDIRIKVRLLASKVNEADPLLVTNAGFTPCIDDKTFEENLGRATPKLLSDNTQFDVGITPILESTDPRFDMFRHRYKVRRNWKEITSRTYNLSPGQNSVLSVIEKGPHLISKIYLAENDVNAFIPGYYRILVFEIMGNENVASSAVNFATNSISGAAISVIETTTVTLKCVPRTRTTSYYASLDPAAAGELTTSSYRKFSQINDADARSINVTNEGIHYTRHIAT